MNKVIDYAIISEISPDQLTSHVKEAMHDGWVPSGPLVLDNKAYLQAMVKFDR
jgi:hypothetical protein